MIFHIIASVIACIVFAWLGFSFLIKKRIIEDTPTSKIRSAAQGYVELQGLTKAFEDNRVFAPLTGKPCLWYKYQIERYQRSGNSNGWSKVEGNSSQAFFSLDDGSGCCVINPDKADITAALKERWEGSSRYPRTSTLPKPTGIKGFFSKLGRYRYTEWRLNEEQFLYAIGLFQTIHAPSTETQQKEKMKEILTEWKKDSQFLLNKFDVDGDGKIDIQEWETARTAAARKAAYHVKHEPGDEAVHTMSYSPSRGQPFILSSIDPKTLTKRLHWKSLGCLALSLAAGTYAGYLLTQNLF
ncbi:GIDE domain-containing protein [Aliikangiella sp. G2MR2-5]|uniref:GIDE domain-containing protein n=1 Tax=Aliikangiella sp. G2MR2-5 TaxID=2788943 RepID=UPI0018A9E1FA|nr:GIDE domain-containing protein [Aliikangiella sp. G2MR2-5]